MKKTLLLLAALVLVLTACSTPDITPLQNLPDDYSLEDAKADGCVVFENGDVTSGQSVWTTFVKASNKDKAADIRLAYYYTLLDASHYAPEYYEEIKDEYPKLFIVDLTFDGGKYTITDYSEDAPVIKTYQHLKKYEGAPNSADAIFSYYTYYVLVNNDTVTWDQIEHGMISSQLGDQIDHYRVYSDLVMK